jgi:hypothetical protein
MLNQKSELMLTNFSWGNYSLSVALLTTGWYLFVGFRFYLDDIRKIVTGEQKIQFRSAATPAYEQPEPMVSPESTEPVLQSSFAVADPTFDDVDRLIEKLKNVIADTSKRKLVKEEFTHYLALVLQEYPSVKNSPFKSSVSEFIVSECDKLETLHLTQEEAEILWNDIN